MTAEPTFGPELARAAEAVLAALASVESAAGIERAAYAATFMLRLATAFTLQALGPVAARQALAATWRDLQAEIEAANAGSSALQ
jgi:hypothetical protein